MGIDDSEYKYQPAPEPDGWPETAEGGTTIGADHDFMASDWIPFGLGVLCSSVIWLLILLSIGYLN